MKIKSKLSSLDEELLFKSVKIQYGDKAIITPIKTGNIQNNVSEINELLRKFSLEKIDKCISDEKEERRLNTEIKRELTSGINFFFVDYNDDKIPKKNHIELLADIQYEHSDVSITPLWSELVRKLNEERLLDTFLELTNLYIDIVKTMNSKTIIGVIPSRMPRQFLEPIIKNYHNKDITSFVLDLDGRSIDANTSWIRNLLRLMKDFDLVDETFVYTINSYQGRFMKNINEVIAKDFVAAGFGADILGLNHVPPRMSSEAWEKIRRERSQNTLRLFSRQSYGYRKSTESELNEIGIRGRKELTKFNITEQYKESRTLQKRLNEQKTVEPYFKSKSLITDNLIRKIKKLKAATEFRS